MSRLIIALALCVILSCVVNCQTFSNCKDLGSGYKVEWTADTTNNRLTARFTVPSSTGWAGIGLKSASTSGMSGSTILLASKASIVGEYYASANGQPSAISGAPYYNSASSSISGSTTTVNLVRSLTRPGTAPATYYEISSGSSMKLLIASHSSTSFPSKHDSTSAFVLDFFAASTCTQAQGSTKAANSTKTSTSNNRTNDSSQVSMGREVFIVISMILALFATLAMF